MLQAERAMRDELAAQTLGAVADRFSGKAPETFFRDVGTWMDQRLAGRTVRSAKPPKEPRSGQ